MFTLFVVYLNLIQIYVSMLIIIYNDYTDKCYNFLSIEKYDWKNYYNFTTFKKINFENVV